MLRNDEIDHLLQVSLNCVKKAMETAKEIYSNKQNLSIGNKPDNTPVTIADYCCQYIIMKDLKEKFPDIPFIAEEESALISEDFLSAIRDQLHEPSLKRRQIEEAFDKADFPGNSDMFWAVDPIDGTRGFLLKKGGQYCICLALLKKIENSQNYEPIIGILGSPNLTNYEIVYSVKGRGTFINHQLIPRRNPIEKNLSEAVITIPRIAINGSKLPFKPKGIIEMDSQCKYIIVLVGSADIYYRPLRAFSRGYREKIWDHAAGVCIIRESGGEVYSIEKFEPIQFSYDQHLNCPDGIIACMNSSLGHSFINKISDVDV
jgi:3'(2'), 5'-bisphosphate nucleotidase